MSIAESIAQVRERMVAACRRAGRDPAAIRLIAVTKTVAPQAIREAYDAGLRDFGENRVQETESKRAALADLTATWHLIGHLQTNKAKSARNLFQYIQSIDSLRLAQKVEESASLGDEQLPVLLQVKLGDEPGKSGVRPAEVIPLAEQVNRLRSLDLRGLMAIPPFFEDPKQARPFFRELRQLAAALEAARLPGVRMTELSMGMSHDFEVAIEEGATMVRVGTAIFGERSKR
jgi:pyridoxal phosphate enzyme (YggS family)